MKIALTLLCRNESDIIGQNIEFHLRAGVDFIIVTDNASEDDTIDKIIPFVRKGEQVELIREQALTHDQAIWVTKMAHRAAVRGADWVINADADEFWWPLSGTLQSALSTIEPSIDILEIQRHNFQPVHVGDRSEGDIFARMIFRNTRSVNSLGNPLPSKVLHRGSLNVQVDDGNHSVRFFDRIAVSQPTRAIEILHFPMRSYEQFARKIELGTRALERNERIMPNVGQSWRHLYHQYFKTGDLREYYCSHELKPEVIEKGLQDGSLVIDTRLRDFISIAMQNSQATR